MYANLYIILTKEKIKLKKKQPLSEILKNVKF